METAMISNGGIQYVPQIAAVQQIIYLDFDGETTSYNGEILSLDNVEVETSSLTEERINNIVTALNEKYASQNVIFVTERPVDTEYSTIFIGKTAAFDQYGNFTGLAETIDEGNLNKSDNAFVTLDTTAPDSQIIATISHETDHLLGTLDHGGDGLKQYGNVYHYNLIFTGQLNSNKRLWSNGISYSSSNNGSGVYYEYVSAVDVTLLPGGGFYGNDFSLRHAGTNNAYISEINSQGVVKNVSGLYMSGSYRFSVAGTATSVTLSGYVNSDGRGVNAASMTVLDGAVADLTSVNAWGKLYVQTGGTARQTKVSGGEVSVAGTLADTTATGGSVWVESGGVVSGGNVSQAVAYIRDGGKVTDITLCNGGTINFSSFSGTAHNLTLTTGAQIWGSGWGITHGGSNSAFISEISQKDSQGVVKNVSGLYMSGRYCFSVAGTATSVTLSGYVNYDGRGVNAASMTVLDGAVADLTSVNAWGKLYVQTGGTARQTKVSGGEVSVAGTLADTTVTGGSVWVNSGGVISGGVCSTGVINVSSGAFAEKVTVAGSMYIYGSAADISISRNGFIQGNSSSLSIRHLGSSAAFISNINSDGSIGNISGLQTSGYGRLGISGTAEDCILKGSDHWNRAYMTVFSGGLAKNIALNNEYAELYISAGGTAVDVTIASNGFIQGNGLNIRHTGSNSALISINSDGSVSNISGLQTVGYGRLAISGVAEDCILRGNGDQRISMTILSGGLAKNTALNNNAADLFILSGAVASATVVSGGSMFISNGGMAVDTIVKTGTVQVSSGGTLCGSVQIHSGAVVSAYSGASVDFTLTDRTAADGYLFNDLSRISGAPTYTITVSADQAEGTYKLAQGASRFTGTISIGDGTANYGSVTLNGDTLVYGATHYSLNSVDGNLTLSVVVASAILTGDASGVSWKNVNGENFTVEYSQNSFDNVLQVQTSGSAVDTHNLPAGTFQWQVNGIEGENIVSDGTEAQQELVSDADGCLDIFFAKANGTWENSYAAQHLGNGAWEGTKEQVLLAGKNKIADIFNGSDDANILVLTDNVNGDALFVDDIYTALGDQARFSQIDEIRAGAGDDIVDMTSQRYAYTGSEITIYGGSGNDTIWGGAESNSLFGDAGNDRLVGSSGNDVIAGGSGSDSMHGGGGDDIFTFGGNWGNDTVEQLENGSVTLWFESGSEDNWNAETLTYSDGVNSVTVSGVTEVTLKFGGEPPVAGAFLDGASEKVFEDKNKGFIA